MKVQTCGNICQVGNTVMKKPLFLFLPKARSFILDSDRINQFQDFSCGFPSNIKYGLVSGTRNLNHTSASRWKLCCGNTLKYLRKCKVSEVASLSRGVWHTKSNPSKCILDSPWIIQSANNLLGEFNPPFLFMDCPWAFFSFLFEIIKWVLLWIIFRTRLSTMLNSSDLPAAACEGPLCSCTGVTGLSLINLKKGWGEMAELHRTQFCTIDYSLITLSSQDDPAAEADTNLTVVTHKMAGWVPSSHSRGALGILPWVCKSMQTAHWAHWREI